MTIFNLGSINADHFYRLPHLTLPGETLAATAYDRGLGGKGANQSVAAARAGAVVRHIGATGADGAWMRAELAADGVDCAHVAEVEVASGHAIIMVDASGENSIVLFPGANRAVPLTALQDAMETAAPGDWLLMQNETSAQLEAVALAKARGVKVAYSAAPFEAEAVRKVLADLDLLLLNAVEAAQLCEALGTTLDALPVKAVCVTHGAKGAVWHDLAGKTVQEQPAFKVTPVDTTAAGDTFAGYLVAGLAEGMTPPQALRLAAGASALKVTRAGTAAAIPTRAEVDVFLQDR
ncbi:ribokinase [Rhodobacter capsulatus]|uniref:ribokinase n=1 Tax=Rhodobacter capsulatus TaxID=1061 RepID=UPI0006DCCD48|nr:ribokinase [Rhodobacter capsulatus]KQB14554.1 ribokinase [Rhodobacter capsulatus]KQB14853.1 ribokinase [Rhodobacter capsulatus]PZX25061.1 ribokinase [Rhodobacter capsulatus]QNR63231.1 ribokinase [Rhodobacter capsulatus]